jgi:hypothetical protein
VKNILSLLTTIIVLLLVPNARAGLVLFDVDLDPSGWKAAIAGTAPTTAYDFQQDTNIPVSGATGFFGPLTSVGAGPVSPGTVSPGVTISSLAINPILIADLFAIGPSTLGNSANTVYSNQLNNGLTIEFTEPVTAFEFNALAHASQLANFRFFDSHGAFEVFNDVRVDGPSGHRLGIVGTGGTQLSRIDIFVPPTGGDEGVGGHEGLTLDAVMYRGTAVPIPSTALLMMFGLLGINVRRQKRIGCLQCKLLNRV